MKNTLIIRKKRWRKTPKRIGHDVYCEWTGGYRNSVCYNCHFSCKGRALWPMSHNKPVKCPNCHEMAMYNVGLTARPPKKSASKSKWKKFWEMFKDGSHPSGCR